MPKKQLNTNSKKVNSKKQSNKKNNDNEDNEDMFFFYDDRSGNFIPVDLVEE